MRSTGKYSQADRGAHPGVPHERLTASDGLYRTLVETSTDLICVTDGAGTIGYANPACQEVLGYAPEELLGARFADLVAPGSQADVASICERAARGRPQAPRQVLARSRDGAPVYLSLGATPLAGGDRELDGVALTGTDVSVQ